MRSRRSPLQSQIIIHSNGDLLIGTEIPLSSLDRRVAEQEFDLLQIPAVLAAEFGAGAAQVVGAEALNPDLGSLHQTSKIVR